MIEYFLHKLLLFILILRHNFKVSVLDIHCPFEIYSDNECEYNVNYINSKTNCTQCNLKITGQFLEAREVFSNITEAYSLTKYIQPARDLVHQHKWSAPSLSVYFGQSLHHEFKDIINQWKIDYIIPVPSFISRERPWSPSLLLAIRLAELSRIKILPAVLKKEKATHLYSQSKQTRKENLQGAFSLGELPRGQYNILLVDDLIASGLSVEQSAQLLKSQNSNINIYVLSLCSSKE